MNKNNIAVASSTEVVSTVSTVTTKRADEVIQFEKFEGLQPGQSRTFKWPNWHIKTVRARFNEMGFDVVNRSPNNWIAIKRKTTI